MGNKEKSLKDSLGIGRFFVRHSSHQSAEASVPRCRQTDCTHCLQEPHRLQKFYEFRLAVQGLPGYKLHPSGLAIESIGDLSGLSQEREAEIYNSLRADFLARNATEDTLRAKPCRYH